MNKIKKLDFDLLEKLLKDIEKPGRYINNEVGARSKRLEPASDFYNLISMALVFPDIYEIGMSNLGLQILYDIVNKHRDFTVERVFSPWIDFEKKLREQNVKIFSLENRIFLDCFDLIGFTVQHELLYTNILNILDLGGININSRHRRDKFPLVCAGGPAVVNPQPLSRFMDFFVVGDGEEVIISILERVKIYRANNKDKEWFLKEISKLDGIYIPGFYKFHYFPDGSIESIKPGRKVRKAIVEDLNKFEIVQNPIIPNIKPVHDRFAVEIMRGCGRGCRFCQAGIIYRPVRKREVESLIRQSAAGIKNTGYDEISFLSLSSSDYSEIEHLLDKITSSLKLGRLSISLPSMRLDSFNLNLAELIQSGRKTGLTFAPEAGSQRMRDIINKNIKENEMLDCIKMAFSRGWEKIKLYFMIGLPFENNEDISQIVELIEKVIMAAKDELSRKKLPRLKINISINAFCPKPFTPFQWVAQDNTASLDSKFNYILKNVPKRYVNISWTDSRKNMIECALSRGNELVGEVIEGAWKSGARFDNWTEFFKFHVWEKEFRKAGLDISFFVTRGFADDEILPWDVIDIGVSKKFLLREYDKSKRYLRDQDKI
ncbi:MAG: TIGR03960 family B12-binding radical SAM protein [Actinobacteria bacterium]|nr:TIGR03960 family B12-binding radical SAM protein [Actinomycetota bacterium]